MIPPWSADELHPVLALARDHAPAVVLVLVDPPFAVEGCRDKRRLHERHGREVRRNHLFHCTDRG